MRVRRDSFFPGTEQLSNNEMRVIALGTGRLFMRKAQANAGWLVELGDGKRYLFDFGYGTFANFASLEVPLADVTAYFVSHLHAAHVGDFGAFWLGGWAGGRTAPLRIIGPNNMESQFGTAHFVQAQISSYAWDSESRRGLLPASGESVEVTEFDWAACGEVIHEEGDVTVRSFPAVHIHDGAVGYRLDWRGLSFVFSGDTAPNRILIEQSRDADIVVHDTFNTVGQLMQRSGYDRETAEGIGRMAHTSPREVGRVFEAVRPREAVSYNFYNDFDTAPEIAAEIRESYSGPLRLARDLMCWNVTPDQIQCRMAVVSHHTWPNTIRHGDFRESIRGRPAVMSEWLASTRLK